MSKENKNAVVSSLMLGVAFSMFVMLVLYLNNSPYIKCLGALAFFSGLGVGLFTTWELEDDTDSNA